MPRSPGNWANATSGETAIAGRLAALLTIKLPATGVVLYKAWPHVARMRPAAVVQNQRLLEDPHDFVRISAARAMAKITSSKESQLEMLQATVNSYKAVAPNSVTNTTQKLLFSNETLLATNPFGAGIDPDLVKQALEKAILLDPVHGSFMASRAKVWSKDTVVKSWFAHCAARGKRRPDVRRSPSHKPSSINMGT